MILKSWLSQFWQAQATSTRCSRSRSRSRLSSGHKFTLSKFIVSSVVETLEDRALLSPNPLTVAPIFVNESGANTIGTTPLVEAFQFSDGARWSTTFTNGSGLTQGDPTTLRWGIVTDGTFISSGFSEPASGSSLIQFMDGLYGDGGVADNGDLTQKPWFTIFSSSLDRLAQISGLTYTYLAINSQSSGFVSITDSTTNNAAVPEILIGGHSIDGQASPNILAYNYFPSGGGIWSSTPTTHRSSVTRLAVRLACETH